ncbi:Rdx family-domain-containing protein [Amylostereum chailletii]|nr:Rdx family-domain-containing protein [Amylostereum chailletii]
MSGDTNVCVDCVEPSANTSPGVSTASATDVNLESKPYDPRLDPSTFVAPSAGAAPSVIIEFCDRCRWLHRATWTSTELFLTFPPPALTSITVIPLNSEDTAGRFRVWLNVAGEPQPILVWDRKVEGKFPELKELKQRIRDRVQPGKSLGHSDK